MNRILHKLRAGFRLVHQIVDKKIIHIMALNSFFASFYYTFFSRVFYSEHRAVLYGRVKYEHRLKNSSEPNVMLRRNIHRMEKGLIMRPRRNVFARTYIDETVLAYAKAVAEYSSDPVYRKELQWAHDVLEEFFSVTDSEQRIDTAREKFKSLYFEEQSKFFKPYKRNLTNPSPVTYDNLLKLSQRRRSVRWYEPKRVPRDIIDKAMVIAGYAPSACNRQPFVFRIFDDPSLVKTISEIPMGTKGFSQNFPGIIAIVGDLSAYFHERDRHIIYIDASLSAMALMYALETLGVSSCTINWPDFRKKEKQMLKILGLSQHERVVMLISYGYPDPEGMVPYSLKKGLDQLRKFN